MESCAQLKPLKLEAGESTAKHLKLGKNYGSIYLTKREAEVLRCAVLGYSAKRTAKFLNISYRTVESYLDILKLKLKCDSKGQLIELVITSEILRLLGL